LDERGTRDGAELERLFEAVVGEEEIDHLGHMNVRYYHEKGVRGSAALAAAHGLGPEACRGLGAVLELRDTFTRHYREQLVGAPLAVCGGVLAVRGDGLRVYLELWNREREELSATWVHELVLRDADARARLPLPEMAAQSAGAALVAWPEHGRPRTLELHREPPALALEEARARGLAMRKPRTLAAEECDAEGHFPAARYQELFWGGEPARPGHVGPFLRPLPDGGRLGWATLESRGMLAELPSAGTRIQSFGADVDITGKTHTTHMWLYDVEREALLCTSSVVNLAFDVTKRRAIEIPAGVRAELETRHHPDLR
jgi:acyl-CoA thioesterase FadM